MAVCRDHLKAIIKQINKEVGQLPDILLIKNTQHGYLSGWADNKFIATVIGVKCFIHDAATAGTPEFTRYPMITTHSTTTFAADSTGPARW